MKNKFAIFFMSIIVSSCIAIKNNGADNKVYTNLNECFEDTFKVLSTKDFITKFELTINGEIKGKGKLSYCHVPFQNETEILLEGIVNKTITGDWYDERCLIKYEPIDSIVTGKLIIDFTVY